MSARTTCLVLGSVCCLAFPWSQAPGEVATDGTVGPRTRALWAGLPDWRRARQPRRRQPVPQLRALLDRDRRERHLHGAQRRAQRDQPGDGGAHSDIDGTLASTIPGADLYFINPAGVLFGPNASLDVQGSFHVSTADEVRFADGAAFSATNPAGSSFTVAAPEAFGFVGGAPRPIMVDRSTLKLTVGESFSIVGGDITILGNPNAEEVNEPGTLRAEAGQITLAAAAGPAHLDVTSGRLQADQRGRIQLRDQALVDVSGNGGGAVRIDSSAFVLERQSLVFADNTGPLDAEGGISVDADRISITGGSALMTAATGTGDAGRLTVQADALEVRSGGQISSTTSATGDAGELTVTARDLEIRDGGQIISATVSAGDAGDASTVTVTVTAGDLEIRDGGQITSATVSAGNAGAVTVTVTAGDLEIRDGSIRSVSGGAGDAGSVTVTADRLTLLEGGQISSSPLLESTGAGGQVQVTARDSLLIAGHNARNSSSGIFASAEGAANSEGAAGNVTVTARDLEIRDSGQITSSTLTAGDAGSVTVTADRLTLLEGGQISSSPGGESTAAGGQVQVTARDSLLIAGRDARNFHSGIFASAEGAANSEGASGNVTVTAGDLEIRDSGQITSSTLTAGDAGRVTVTADRLTLLEGGQISSSPGGESTAAGGQVQVTARDSLLIAGRDARNFRSGIFASAEGAANSVGAAGDVTVTVTAGDLEIRDSGLISSATLTAGDAGRVTVTADRLTLLEGGQISSSPGGESTAAGGQVQVTARDSLLIAGRDARNFRSGIFASAEGAANSVGAAGDVTVTVTAGDLEIRDGGVISSAALRGGDAGKVTVEADRLVLDRAGEISSAAFGGGDAGEVTVVADRLVLDRALITTTSASAGGGEIQLLVGDLIDLHDSAITTSVIGGADNTAGSIGIGSSILVIDGSQIQANAPGGEGGFLTIVADNIVVPGGDFDALLDRGDISATGGDPTRAGTIAVNAPEINLAGDLVTVQAPLLDVATLLGEPCGARRDVGASSLIAAGRGGLPASPDAPLPSGYGAPAADAGQRGAAASAAAHPAMLHLAGCAGAP